ncbi:MAG: serine/threonine protein kinase [Actinobacteria bacterium]|nr:serine/threonine protein kinase [Actinomycetota bacterium]
MRRRGAMVTPLQPGDPRRLGKWRLVGRLGAGGMGVVYLARGRRGLRVAIKVPRSDLARDPEFRERFCREAEAASAVTARCTARVLEVRADGKRPYIVTEYVDGPTLQDAVAADGPIAGPRLLAFATGVAEAMAAMHAAGVTHRDLTPGNVILGRWGPKVIDFGIARSDGASTLTQTGMRIGTPAWMAPEQARGDRVGPAVDTFAWGTLVAYAGTGRHPFGNGRVDAVLYRVVHEAPDLAGLEPALAPLVSRALDKEPGYRPPPAALLDALTPMGATRPETATRVMPASRAPVPRAPFPIRGGRRWLRTLALLLLIAIAGFGLGGGLIYLLNRDDQNAPALTPPDPGPETTTTVAPTTTVSPRSVTAYCAGATEFFDRFEEFESEFGIFSSQEEYDEAFVEFAAENLGLLRSMAETAPEEIAADVAVVVGAYEQAAEGDLSGFDSFEVDDAQDNVTDFEDDECGIDHGLF